eukprot:gene5788-6374_t
MSKKSEVIIDLSTLDENDESNSKEEDFEVEFISELKKRKPDDDGDDIQCVSKKAFLPAISHNGSGGSTGGSGRDSALTSPPLVSVKNVLGIDIRSLPPKSSHPELHAIYNCLQEIFYLSTYRLNLSWMYQDNQAYFKPTLTFTGRKSKIYTFQLVFQTSKTMNTFPSVPPRIVPQFVLRAPLFMTLYNHPILTSKHWNESTSSRLVANALEKAIDYLEIHLEDTVLISTSVLPGDLSLVTRGKEWNVIPAESAAIEVLIAELYGDYTSAVRNIELYALRKTWMNLVVLPPVKGPKSRKGSSSKSSTTGAASKKGKGSAKARGIGYSSGHDDGGSRALPTEGRTMILLEKLATKMERVRQMVRSQRRSLSWILYSPLPEVLFAVLQEYSREETFRHNAHIEMIFMMVWAVELVMRDCWGRESVEISAADLPARPPTPPDEDEGENDEESDVGNALDNAVVEGSSDTSQSLDRKVSLYYTLIDLYGKLQWIETGNLIENSRAEWLQTIRSSSKLYQSAKKVIELDMGEEGKETLPKVVHCSDLLSGHVFYRLNSNVAACRSWLRELSFIADNLPDEVCLFVSDEHPNYLVVAMMIANPDCPYYGGVFLFHVLVPSEYPRISPSVKLITTGDGSVRFNPNLYNCGKVCLSLLGTWSGEPWDPKTSNVTQVIMSILYLIFTEEPFFNEPGYQQSRGSPSGTKQSLCYDWNIFRSTIQSAILYHLQKPSSFYGDSVSSRIWNYYVENWEEKLRPALTKKYEQLSTQLTQLSVANCPAYSRSSFDSQMGTISALVAEHSAHRGIKGTRK